jgi:uncharacterized protein (TIGR02145 family)
MKFAGILILGVIAFSQFSCRKDNIVLHGEIKGIVTNDTTGDPIDSAIIKLEQTSDSAISGSDGKYLLKNIVPGNYNIEVTKTNYTIITKKNVEVISAETKEIPFVLTGSPVLTENVTYLDFGLDSTRLSFYITNSGFGRMIYDITPSQNWINLKKHPVTSKIDSIIVNIDKSGFIHKTSKGEFIIIHDLISEDNIKDVKIPVYINGVMDTDGYYYNVAWIGNQTWMAENLRVGTLLPSSAPQSDNKIIEYYSYNDDRNYYSIYGGLYQWEEMMQYKPTDNGRVGTTQGVCPVGWHIPTNTEWITLQDALGGVAVAGGKLKSTDSPPWQPPNSGASDSSNFSGLPGGLYGTFFTGELIFNLIETNGVWWSSTLSQNDGAWAYTIWSDSTYITYEVPWKKSACSVRCVKDPDKP